MAAAKKFERHVYLKLTGLAEARTIFLDSFREAVEPDSEEVSTADSLDRITAEPVFARFSSPRFHSAAMDGIAVKAEDTYGASPDQPRTLILAEQAYRHSVTLIRLAGRRDDRPSGVLPNQPVNPMNHIHCSITILDQTCCATRAVVASRTGE